MWENSLTWILFILLAVGCINYLTHVGFNKLKLIQPTSEGFTNNIADDTTELLTNESLYDSFYSSIYDQITQNHIRTNAKVALLLHAWTSKTKPEHMIVLDAGCGSGIGLISLAQMNVGKCIGVDKSKPMLDRARTTTFPQANISEQQQKSIELRQADLLSPLCLGGSEATHGMVLYFSIYYLPDMEAFFRNMFLWIKPGGEMAVEVVNKHKFDPMLESASPWLGFSLQKYSKDRVTESNVVFDKFNYTGKFDLTGDNSAEFRETFRFTDSDKKETGKQRRQIHRLYMPDITEIVKSAKYAGWVYTQYVDLTVIGFEYSFLLLFRHP